MFRTEYEPKIFMEYPNLKNIFAKYWTTKTLHFLCTATFFPECVSVQVQPNKTDLIALSKRYCFQRMTAQIFKEGKKNYQKKLNHFTCPEEIVKDLLWPKFHFILMTVTQHISFFTVRKYIQVTRSTLQTKKWKHFNEEDQVYMRQLIATHISTQFVIHPQPDSRTLPTANAQHGSFLP